MDTKATRNDRGVKEIVLVSTTDTITSDLSGPLAFFPSLSTKASPLLHIVLTVLRTDNNSYGLSFQYGHPPEAKNGYGGMRMIMS
jgi:hypothetical protein